MIPSFTFREREDGVARRDRDVGRGDEARATAERVPLHTRDDRCGAHVDRLEHSPQRVRVGDVLLVRQVDRRAHPVDIGSRREALALACEQHCASAADVDERLCELADQRCIERVVAVWARQGDPQEIAVTLDQEVRHRRRA